MAECIDVEDSSLDSSPKKASVQQQPTVAPTTLPEQQVPAAPTALPKSQSSTKCVCLNCLTEPTKQLRGGHGKLVHVCHEPGCGQIFTQTSGLVNHLKYHTGKHPFMCAVPGCGATYARRDRLNNHVQRKHNLTALKYPRREDPVARSSMYLSAEQFYQCQVPGCPMGYLSLAGLRRHESRSHTREEIEKCEKDPEARLRRQTARPTFAVIQQQPKQPAPPPKQPTPQVPSYQQQPTVHQLPPPVVFPALVQPLPAPGRFLQQQQQQQPSYFHVPPMTNFHQPPMRRSTNFPPYLPLPNELPTRQQLQQLPPSAFFSASPSSELFHQQLLMQQYFVESQNNEAVNYLQPYLQYSAEQLYDPCYQHQLQRRYN